MKRKLTILAGSLFLVIVLLACAAPAPTPAPSPTPAPAPAPSPTPQVFILKYGSLAPATATYSLGQDWYLTEVEKRTQGRVKFERYWANALAPETEMADAIRTGAADSGLISGFYHPGKTPLLTMGQLPGLYSGLYPGLMAWYELHKQVQDIKEELANINARFLSITAGTNSGVLANKPMNSMEDFKGLRARVMGRQGEVFKELGGVAVGLPSGEVYEGIQRGTLDGIVFPPGAIMSYKLEEVAKYYYDVPFGSNLTTMVINQQVWNSLPPDIQKIMEDVALEHPKAYTQIYEIEGDGKGIEVMKAAGVKITASTPTDMALMEQITRDKIWPVWIQDMEGKGLPGRQVLDTYLRLREKYVPQDPFKEHPYYKK